VTGVTDGMSFGWGPNGDVFVTAQVGGSVKRFDGATGAFLDDFVPPASGGLLFPTELLFHVVPEPFAVWLLALGGLATALGNRHQGDNHRTRPKIGTRTNCRRS